MGRKSVVVDGDTPIRDILVTNNVSMTKGSTTLNGVTLSADDLSKSLRELGINETSEVFILNYPKADGN